MLEVSSVFGIKFDLCNSYYTTFKDNKGAIEISKEPKYRTWTKNLSIKWYHFREYIKQGTSKIVYIEKNEQEADIMTKSLAKPQFEYQRKQIMRWWIYSGIIQSRNMRDCECTENMSKEKYVCSKFTVLITLYVNSRLNVFTN